MSAYNSQHSEDRDGLHFDDPRFEVGAPSSMYSETLTVKDGVRPTQASVAKAVSADLDDLAAWLRKQTWSDFAQSLAEQYDRRGDLSPKQVESAKSMRAKVEARNAERQAPAAKAEPAESALDLSELGDGYYAVPNGETRLKVRINRPGPNSKWLGYIFVSDGAEYGQRTNYGRQTPGGTYSGQIQDQLRKIMADPREAMAEYGKLTGTCGMCGRRLEDEESVAIGIGPICRNK